MVDKVRFLLFLVTASFWTMGCTARPAATAGAFRDAVVVVGVGNVHAKPDIARINVGVESRASTVAEATKQCAEQMNRLLATLKAAQIAERDIQTENYSINFERVPDGPVPMGMPPQRSPAASTYRVSNMVRVTVRDLRRVGPVLDSAVSSGANNVWGVTFEREDMKAIESQLREKAVRDAKVRAAELAKLNDLALGDVIGVSEVVGQRNGPPMPMAAMSAGYAKDASMPIESGELSFQGQIEITYSIKR